MKDLIDKLPKDTWDIMEEGFSFVRAKQKGKTYPYMVIYRYQYQKVDLNRTHIVVDSMNSITRAIHRVEFDDIDSAIAYVELIG